MLGFKGVFKLGVGGGGCRHPLRIFIYSNLSRFQELKNGLTQNDAGFTIEKPSPQRKTSVRPCCLQTIFMQPALKSCQPSPGPRQGGQNIVSFKNEQERGRITNQTFTVKPNKICIYLKDS